MIEMHPQNKCGEANKIKAVRNKRRTIKFNLHQKKPFKDAENTTIYSGNPSQKF